MGRPAFRLTIEAAKGSHGCGRKVEDQARMAPHPVTRCGQDDCGDCRAIAFVQALNAAGFEVTRAELEHMPRIGPADDLLTGLRTRPFQDREKE